ncbi:MAG: hypothetical protein ABSB12_02535 [Candidatus Saccharimonadales bacterium]
MPALFAKWNVEVTAIDQDYHNPEAKHWNKQDTMRLYLNGSIPIILGTDEPRDRKSIFADNNWVGADKNQPSLDIRYKTKNNQFIIADHILPGQKFAFCLKLNSAKLKKVKYVECFSIVQEWMSWIEGATVSLNIEVV